MTKFYIWLVTRITQFLGHFPAHPLDVLPDRPECPRCHRQDCLSYAITRLESTR